jgi:amino acid adenylation domain-containing protein/thioester reductase-like protein
VKSFGGTGCALDCDDVVGGLTDLADRLGVDPSVVVLAGWAAVLARSSGVRDFAVGLPVPGWREGAEHVVGPLANVVPLRCGFDGTKCFGEWVTLVGEWVAAARAHGRVPFERIVEAVDPGRDLSRSPLYQVSFESVTGGQGGVRTPDTVVEPIATETGFAAVDLELTATWRDSGLRLRLDGNADLFDVDTLRQLLDRVVRLLTAGVRDAGIGVSRLGLMDPAERDRVVTGWNQTTVDYPADRCLHELVERQVAASPDAIAVRCGDQELTYTQLNDRANQLATELRSLGVVPESRVGVLTDRSVDSVVGLLGVLKAGGAYVPLDPSYPVQRLGYIVANARAVAVVGPAADVDLATAAAPGSRFIPTPTGETGADNPAVVTNPNNLAYVIYTSGSTGQPKGVAVNHRHIVASTAARWTHPGFNQPDRYLVMAPLTFDASGGGLYCTLTRGGTVILPTETEVQDPRALAALIRSAEVTHFDGVPSQYAVLLEADTTGTESLRTCVLAGEALPPTLVGAHFERNPDTLLQNEYGPTEATVWAAVCDCRPEHGLAGSVPIGRPIPNAQMYLLDEYLAPVPPGVAAELYIGGDAVARGYVNQPGLTAQRFVPDPFGGRPGARLYRTGDRARYLRDGMIEFLGRVDHQVKIRGFRVELAEIENVILRHPHVAEAVVTTQEPTPGNHRLLAHVVASAGHLVTPQDLSAHLLAYLPDYMVPSAVVTLDRMPLTVQGKIDRASLPRPDVLPDVADRTGPTTSTEAAVAEQWSKVLGVETVDIHTGFFDLGGDSLLVARLVARLARQFDVTLPVEEIFRVPTVAGIAGAIDTHQRRKAGQLDNEALYAMELAELRNEAKLDDAVRVDGLPTADYLNPEHVFVTGATGYIGCFLVAELVRKTSATVHCLVRGEDDVAAYARLEGIMRSFEAWDESYRDRIRVLAGDLAKPLVGLSPEQFDDLGEKVDAIYHSGAMVNFTMPYEVMKAANVGGTGELLKLACHRKVKAFHHVSTMDMFIASRADRPWLEAEHAGPPNVIPQGYPRSKWVSEHMVIMARERGLPACVFRPWIVVGHTETGVAHQTDYMFVGLKGYLQLGFLPAYSEMVNAVPVDYFCAALVHISLREQSFGKFFNIGNLEPVSFPTLYSWLRSFGYSPTLVDEKLGEQRTLDVPEDNALYPLTPMIRANRPATVAMHAETQQSIDPVVECRNVLEALEGTGIRCPKWTEEMAHASLRYMVDIGFLPAPGEVAVSAV